MDHALHWANLGVLFAAALIPFPTAVMADAVSEGDAADERVAVALYALAGVLLSVSWMAFFHYLSRHPDLLTDETATDFFARERIRPLAGLALYAAAGVLGYLVSPRLALVIFFILPAYYGVTSHGLGLRGG